MDVMNVNISRKNSSYPIFIENNEIVHLKTSIEKFINEQKYIVVINETVNKLYAQDLAFDKENVFILPDGENNKNFTNYKKIMNFALKKHLTRKDFIIAVGGGVVGDLAGFVASTYMRGIGFIQVPTTLLACTDSSVGGKVAINSDFGKNLIGSFYQPNAVFVDIAFLLTLDDNQYKSGLGEILKYSFIESNCLNQDQCNLMNFLNENYQKIINRDILTLIMLVKCSIGLKAMVVEKDEKESGLRKILNYGHTYGHAVETITKYKKYTHGQCVIEGIYFALELALALGFIEKDYKFICEDLIQKFGYKKLPKYDINKIIKIMKSDKKVVDNNITFVLPVGYSKVSEYSVTDEELIKLIKG